MTDLIIANGRLKRKIERLKTQRNYWQAEYKKLREILDKFPFIESRHRTLTNIREEIANKKAMQTRLKEQEALIERLLKEQKNDNPK